MACGPCAARAAAAAQARRNSNKSRNKVSQKTVKTSSSYTIEQLTSWEIKLQCIKTQSLYVQASMSSQVVNAYLGILRTAINNPNSASSFSRTLDAISSHITRLNVLKVC